MNEEEYRLEFFEDEGFTRKKCPECGRSYWTRNPEKETCGEPPCGEYTFIGNPIFESSYTLEEMREEFLSFFEGKDHERIDPYPVDASRWRDDVLLTQASIYDFQPHVTSGKTPPPANPLCISQPCIRMQDIDNVGKTGRHTLAFEMMAHHSFNSRASTEENGGSGYAYDGEVYWKEETVRYCYEFLDYLGAPLDDVTFIESPWVGGGNAGPAFEVILRGVELATLVFMDLEIDPNGEYEMKDGNTYSKMDTYIVDTGYGLERFAWVSQGTPTVYESIYPEMVTYVSDNLGVDSPEVEDAVLSEIARLAGYMDTDEVEDIDDVRQLVADDVGMSYDELTSILEPLENIFAIADHSRVLAYMLGDGIVPSNAGTGYLARMVIRRTMRMMDSLDMDVDLRDLVDRQARRLGYSNRERIQDMILTEQEKYRETMNRGSRRVKRTLSDYEDEGALPVDELIELYDSHGIQPEMVKMLAGNFDVAVNIPDDFYSKVAERHETRSIKKKDEHQDISNKIQSLPDTNKLFYEDQSRLEFEAVVLDSFEDEDGDGYYVVLDQTMFYPEGGGQPSDLGVIENAEIAHVDYVFDVDGKVVHHMDKDPGKGEFIRGRVDGDRRRSLMRHHTATHIVIDAAREVLGEHIRQAGAQKGVESSRIDVTHHKRLSSRELAEIELVANRTVMDNFEVDDKWLERHEAEDKYGFDLYQGGIPEGESIRLIQIDRDIQACGGTHVSKTGEVGYISVFSSERVQDGVERLHFSAGEAAVAQAQETRAALNEVAETFGVPVSDAVETAERFFVEWKERGKEIEELRGDIAESKVDEVEVEEVKSDVSLVTEIVEGNMDELRAMANSLVEQDRVAVLIAGNGEANLVVGVPDSVDLDAGEIAKKLSGILGGGGGGTKQFGQGGGPDADKMMDVVEKAPSIIKEEIQA